VYDEDNPELKFEAMFPSMEEFRLAVMTYCDRTISKMRGLLP
jgi:hypothetical protein